MSNRKILFHPGKYILYTEGNYHSDYFYIRNIKELNLQEIQEDLQLIIEGPFDGNVDYDYFTIYYFIIKENLKCTEESLGEVVTRSYLEYGNIEDILNSIDITDRYYIKHILDCIDLESIEEIDIKKL